MSNINFSGLNRLLPHNINSYLFRVVFKRNIWTWSVDTRSKLNVHNTFIRCYECHMNNLCLFTSGLLRKWLTAKKCGFMLSELIFLYENILLCSKDTLIYVMQINILTLKFLVSSTKTQWPCLITDDFVKDLLISEYFESKKWSNIYVR